MIGAIVNNLMPDEKCFEIDENDKNETNPPLPIHYSIYNKFPEFWNLMTKHRLTFTMMARSLRFSAFISSPLSFIFRFPLVFDTQLKINFFNHLQKKKLEKQGTQKLEIQNANVLENSIKEMLVEKSPSDWAENVTVTVLDSENDWYTDIVKELFDPKNGIFRLTPNLRCLDVNPERCSEEDLMKYKFAGFFLALSLKQNKKLNISLAPSIFKHLLRTKMNLHDLEIIDLTVARSYQRILNEPAEGLGLFFTIGVEREGKPVEIELIPNGSKIPVTEENKKTYIEEMLKFHFTNYAQKQIEAFKEGFYSLLNVKEIQLFTADELEMLLCGVPKIEVEDLRKNCIISLPYSLEHPVVKRFFAMLKKWDQITLGKLLWFITGSSQLPIGGFETLKKYGQVIHIEKGSNPNSPPMSHTCFSILDLPEYQSLDYMEQMFFVALDNCI
ncbi:E3 ubiquitin-protein ligase NEDD4-like [Histomonas meleagridis]|uniref:E3 ubiquitin-protein ligase NEDD4-like n=1 Tax=Histomonas meleagridis TaxID=135588 RepID=UPI003559E26F|nr:E3 ubiquitin-protein ligase NEDD4-like [Histomonas meleagridis]KAH0802857.1 E3 ubiquitin-protein ligase NEDD4-like [Histomonas meleagridis]